MNATLRDVALKAGVSVKTVSNVVNGYVHVKEEMRERVQAAIDELNYQPNLSARYLRTKRVGVLALAMPYLSNAYFAEIGDAIIAVADAYNYTVLIDRTNGQLDKERLVLNGLRPHLIDGVIFSSLSLKSEDFLARQIDAPLVLLGEHFLNVPYDHISIDNVAAARQATNHLIEIGKRRIAAIGAPNPLFGDVETTQLRLRGYSEALMAAGYSLDSQLIISELTSREEDEKVPLEDFFYKREGGARSMRQLLALDHPPDGVFCFNDLMALGAIRAIYESGLRIPEDIAVVGFDGIEESRFSTPSLTTIVPDKEEIAKLAITFLLGRIDGSRTVLPERKDASFRLLLRESTLGRGRDGTDLS